MVIQAGNVLIKSHIFQKRRAVAIIVAAADIRAAAPEPVDAVGVVSVVVSSSVDVSSAVSTGGFGSRNPSSCHL